MKSPEKASERPSEIKITLRGGTDKSFLTIEYLKTKSEPERRQLIQSLVEAQLELKALEALEYQKDSLSELEALELNSRIMNALRLKGQDLYWEIIEWQKKLVKYDLSDCFLIFGALLRELIEDAMKTITSLNSFSNYFEPQLNNSQSHQNHSEQKTNTETVDPEQLASSEDETSRTVDEVTEDTPTEKEDSVIDITKATQAEIEAMDELDFVNSVIR